MHWVRLPLPAAHMKHTACIKTIQTTKLQPRILPRDRMAEILGYLERNVQVRALDVMKDHLGR